MAATRRLWIDTDTASDDAVAIVMALLYVAYLVHAFRSPDESGASHGTARWSPRLALLVLALSA